MLSPRSHFQDVEYEDDFLFFHFLHRVIAEPEDTNELNRIVGRWEVVLEGGTSGYLDVCRTLLPGNGDDFEAGFDSLLQSRWRQLKEYREAVGYDQEMFAVEGKVFIEGLAVLRIAEMKGCATSSEYRLIPDIAKVPLGTPLPAPTRGETCDEMGHPVIENQTPFAFEPVFLVDEDGRPLLVPVLKATFSILDDGKLVLAEKQATSHCCRRVVG